MRVHVPVQAGRIVDVAEESVLACEPSELGVVVPSFCVVEVGLSIELVSRVREALWVFV
jgi:hypothetical protein